MFGWHFVTLTGTGSCSRQLPTHCSESLSVSLCPPPPLALSFLFISGEVIQFYIRSCILASVHISEVGIHMSEHSTNRKGAGVNTPSPINLFVPCTKGRKEALSVRLEPICCCCDFSSRSQICLKNPPVLLLY